MRFYICHQIIVNNSLSIGNRIMRKINLNRRSVIKGAGSIAIALPWLEAMTPAYGATSSPAKRFVTVYSPGGTVYDKWRCNGTQTNYTLSPILAPLEPVKNKLVVLDGLEMKSAIGEQHQAGIIAFLTGTAQAANFNNFAAGPSIDQVIANRIGANSKKKSLQIAVRWATGFSYGKLDARNCANFEDNARFSPIPPRLDPVAIWRDLFGSINADSEATASIARTKSILDFVDGRYTGLAKQLGADDKARLEQHLSKIREIENSLSNSGLPASSCAVPTLIDTSDYNPTESIRSFSNGGSTDVAIPKVGKLMMDMLVMALGCGITNVASLQWTDTEAKHTFPWLNLRENHHYYQHDGGFRALECEQICTWYSQQHAYLLGQMDKVDMGGHSLLDESVVYFGSEIGDPPSHSKKNMPFLLAGLGGGLRGGRLLKYPNQSHNDLLVSILNLFGDPRTRFGDQRFSTGALTGLV